MLEDAVVRGIAYRVRARSTVLFLIRPGLCVCPRHSSEAVVDDTSDDVMAPPPVVPMVAGRDLFAVQGGLLRCGYPVHAGTTALLGGTARQRVVGVSGLCRTHGVLSGLAGQGADPRRPAKGVSTTRCTRWARGRTSRRLNRNVNSSLYRASHIALHEP